MADTGLQYADMPAESVNETDIILSNVFYSQKSLREKNRNLMLALHRLIANSEWATLSKFMSLGILSEFHPSLLKSILIITQQVKDVQRERAQVENILRQKMEL